MNLDLIKKSFLKKSELDQYLSFKDLVKKNMPNPEWLGDFTKDEYEFLLDNESKILIYKIDNQIIASGMTIKATKESLNKFMLDNLDINKTINYGLQLVHPDFVGNGLQNLINKDLDELSIKEGYSYAVGTTNPDNYYSVNNLIKNNFIKTNLIKLKRGNRNVYLKYLNNSKIYLKEPSLEEYWYEQKVLADPRTMEYNAGWEVSYDGYDYDTGCIDFPKERWEKDYNRRLERNRFFAYIVEKENNDFIGYVNFHYNKNQDRYDCGIVIEHSFRGKGYAKDALIELCLTAFFGYEVSSLYDNFEEERNALKLFEKIGFKKTKKYKLIRFKKEIDGIEVCLTKKDFLNYLDQRF